MYVKLSQENYLIQSNRKWVVVLSAEYILLHPISSKSVPLQFARPQVVQQFSHEGLQIGKCRTKFFKLPIFLLSHLFSIWRQFSTYWATLSQFLCRPLSVQKIYLLAKEHPDPLKEYDINYIVISHFGNFSSGY